MKQPAAILRRIPVPVRAALVALFAAGLAWAGYRQFLHPADAAYQGYVEADYVHVASPVAGALADLRVHRGQEVQQNATLFSLEQDYERAALAVATHTLKQSMDKLADAMKGQRPSELATAGAKLGQAEASLRLSRAEFERRQKLYAERTISGEEMDQARADYEVKTQQVRELASTLTTARLGQRSDTVSAAQAEVEAARARVEQAAWTLDQKTQTAPERALVFDTLFSQGEWVPAGKPVVVLLPPRNIKVRFYVPERDVAGLKVGQRLMVGMDGAARGVPARITYISPQAEYTPPVLFSSQSRSKLVFLIEAKPSPADAPRLHPGQPVDVDVAGGR